MYFHRPGIKTKKTLHSALDTKKISAQNTLIKNKIFPQVAEKSSFPLFWFWANKEHSSLTSFYLYCRSRSCMGLEKAVRCFKVISCSVQCLSRRLVDTLHNWHNCHLMWIPGFESLNPVWNQGLRRKYMILAISNNKLYIMPYKKMNCDTPPC